jgi:hypothetical protein
VFDDDRDFLVPGGSPGVETLETVDDLIAVFDGGHAKRQRQFVALAVL